MSSVMLHATSIALFPLLQLELIFGRKSNNNNKWEFGETNKEFLRRYSPFTERGECPYCFLSCSSYIYVKVVYSVHGMGIYTQVEHYKAEMEMIRLFSTYPNTCMLSMSYFLHAFSPILVCMYVLHSMNMLSK
jgi:hypothetical protein